MVFFTQIQGAGLERACSKDSAETKGIGNGKGNFSGIIEELSGNSSGIRAG